MHYDVNKPRISITRPDGTAGAELGQGACWGEAVFWMKLGYTVNVAVYDASRNIYVNHQHFTSADL